MASRIASSRSAEPRPGADDRQVHRGRPPAGGARAAPTTVVEQLRAGDAARRRAVRPGTAARGRRARPPRAARRRPRGARRRRRSGRGAAARRDLDAAERERRRPARTDGCRGRSRYASGRGRRRRAACSPAARSAGTRHLEVGRVAGDDMDGDATGLQQGGLVGPGRRSVGRERGRGASRRTARRTPCGVWAAASADRSTVAATQSPSTRLSGLGDRAATGMAAPCRRPPRRRASTSAGVTSGRAPSWTRTTRVAVGVRAATARRARRTRRATDSWRRAPPATTADDARPAARRAAARSATRSAAVTTTIRSTPAPRRARRASRPAAAAGDRRARACRCRPSASSAPAATTIASRRARPATARSRSIEPRLGEDHPAGDGLEDAGHRRRRGRWSMYRAPPSTTIIVPSSRKPTPWPASLPSWMTRTRSSSPGRTAGFTALASELMFITRTPCSSATRLRLKSLVRIDPAARSGERDELGVDLGDVGDVVLDDLDRRAGLLLHPVEDLEAAPAAVAAQRVGAVGDVLELVEHEARARPACRR